MRIHPLIADSMIDDTPMSPGDLSAELGLFALLNEAFVRPSPAGGLMSDPILVYRAAHAFSGVQ